MKKLSLVVGAMLIFLTSTAANNEVKETGTTNTAAVTTDSLLIKDHLLSFSKSTKLVISDKKGHVIFYNENVQALDFSDWQHGSYVAQVNDEETFEFTL